MRLFSAHISQWDVKFAGKWDSALKGNSARRAHVAGAVGIELAHSEGQYVIQFLAHLLIPQLVARGYKLETLVLGSLTHTNRRDVSKLATDAAISLLVVHPASWQAVSRAVLGPGAFCLNWVQALVYVVLGFGL